MCSGVAEDTVSPLGGFLPSRIQNDRSVASAAPPIRRLLVDAVASLVTATGTDGTFAVRGEFARQVGEELPILPLQFTRHLRRVVVEEFGRFGERVAIADPSAPFAMFSSAVMYW